MKPVLPSFPRIRLETDSVIPKTWDFDENGSLVLLLSEGKRDAIEQTPWAAFLRRRLAAFPETANPMILSAPGGVRTAVAFVTGGLAGFKALSLARKLAGPLLEERTERITVISLVEDTAAAEAMAEALVAAVHAALFRLPKITDKPEDIPPLRAVVFFGAFGEADFGGTEATAEGNNLARWLTHLPGNYLTPASYREYAEALAEREGWEAEFIDRDRLRALGAGAFLSVVEASPQHDAGILRLRYRPAEAQGQALALVGKGVCFDTGGINLKSGPPGMLGMHGDMQGSAVALGTLLALTRVGFSSPVDCWLALAENHIGPNAAKCNDVVTALNGTTIELINTDAEGRMVLADTLALASRENPRTILDFATLTGSVVAALGQRMSGAMSNRRDWVEPIIRAGERCGERVWPLPYEDDYDEDLKSKAADVLQCRTEGAGDHLYAARFLGRFVGEGIGWVHVDMAAGTHKGGLGHIPTDLQGFGVRFGTEWLRHVAKSEERTHEFTECG